MISRSTWPVTFASRSVAATAPRNSPSAPSNSRYWRATAGRRAQPNEISRACSAAPIRAANVQSETDALHSVRSPVRGDVVFECVSQDGFQNAG